MFGIGGFELFIILIFGFLIFGPEKLPEIAKTVGRGIARFREAQQEMNETLGGEKLFDPNNPEEMFKDPVEVLDKLAQKQEERKRDQGGAGAAKATAAGADGKAAAQAGSESAAAPEEGTSGQAASGDEAPKQESFTERKARYERERAARKAAEAEAAKGQPDGASPATTPADGVKVADNSSQEIPAGSVHDAAAAVAEGGEA